VFNGKSALANGDDFRELTYTSDDAAHDELAPIAAELLQFLPQVVLYVGTGPLVQRVVAPLEKGWPGGERRRDRGTWRRRISFRSCSTSSGRIVRFARASSGRWLVSSTRENARFTMHYNETFPDRTSLTDAPNTAYDAFYLFAYAAYAVHATARRSPAHRSRAPWGASTRERRESEAGMTSIFDALTALRSGKDIDLVGSSGSPRSRSEDRGPPARSRDPMRWDRRARAGLRGHRVGAGLSHRTGKLEGILRCP